MNYHCSECKKEVSNKVYNYSLNNFGVSLCRVCQIKKEKGTISGENKKNTYAEGMIKGRIAETLIEELFLSLGWNVFRYGMENTVPGIIKLLKGVRSDVATNIKRMPDLKKKKGKEVFFVEVKFRKDESFSRKKLSKNYPYENTYFIIVSKKHIKCITYDELIKGKEITPTSQNYLSKRKEFDLNKEVIKDFCNFAVQFFQGVE